VARNIAWGIDIGESAIKAVRLRKVGDSVVIQDYRTIPCEARPEEAQAGDREYRVRNALDTLASEVKLKGTVVVVSMAGHDVFPRFIPLPPVEKKRVPEIVRYEARTQMPFPIEEVIWDYQPLSGYGAPGEGAGVGAEAAEGAGEEMEVALFAIKKATVYSFLSNLRLAQLVPDIVEISPLALYNFLIYDRDIHTGTVVIDVGAGNTDLVIIDRERFWTRNVSISGNDITRALQEKYQISFEEAENLKRKAASSKQADKIFGVMRPILDDLIGEVQRSIGYYKSQTRNVRIEQVLLLGNAFKLKGLVEYFRRNLDYEVTRLESLRRVKMAGEGDAEKFEPELPNYAVAIGLALQGLGLARVNINMLPGDIARGQMLRQKIPYAAAAVGLLALPVLLGYGSVGRDLAHYERGIKPVERDIAYYRAREAAQKIAEDLGRMGAQVRQLTDVGSKRQEWLGFFDSLNKVANEMSRQRFLLRAIREVTDEKDAQAVAGRRTTGRRTGRSARSRGRRGATRAAPEPTGLKIELEFEKRRQDTSAADDVSRLRELLLEQKHIRDVVVRRGKKVVRTAERGGKPSGVSAADISATTLTYVVWVTFSSEPLPKAKAPTSGSAGRSASKASTPR